MPKKFTLETLKELKAYADKKYGELTTTIADTTGKYSRYQRNTSETFRYKGRGIEDLFGVKIITVNSSGKVFETKRVPCGKKLDEKKYALARALYVCLSELVKENCNIRAIQACLEVAFELNNKLENPKDDRKAKSDFTCVNWVDKFEALVDGFKNKIKNSAAKKLSENLKIDAIPRGLKTGSGFFFASSELHKKIFALWECALSYEKEYLSNKNIELAKIKVGDCAPRKECKI